MNTADGMTPKPIFERPAFGGVAQNAAVPEYVMVQDRRLGGEQRRYLLTKNPREIMRLPDDIRKCVFYVLYRESARVTKYAGSGFLVSMQLESGGEGGFSYGVTARHLIGRITHNSFDQKVIVRINARDSEDGFRDIETEANDWTHHSDDDSVDVAVAPIAPDMSEFDCRWIPVDMFATEDVIEKQAIGPGDDVVIAGLFRRHSGKKRNIPVVRTGIISAMPSPDDPIEIEHAEIDAYLVETRSIGGLSGSPVFVRQGPIQVDAAGQIRKLASPAYYLLGLIHGHWDIPGPSRDGGEFESMNMGMGIVVPACRILETLNHPEIVRSRKHQEAEIRRRHAPKMD